MRFHCRFLTMAVLIAAAIAPAASAGTVYLTDFTKDANIYSNLNQQFPNTGPANGSNQPNATFLFNPSTFSPAGLVLGSNLANNGVNFMIASNAGGYDYAQTDYSDLNAPLTIGSNVAGASSVSLLTAAYFGVNYNVTFTGDRGATETFNVNFYPDGVPDFCSPTPINVAAAQNGSLTNNVFDQTVLQVSNNLDGCGSGNTSLGGRIVTNSLTEQTFLLSSSFAGQNLVSTVIQTTTYFNRGFDTVVLAETVANASSSTPEPATGVLVLGVLALAIGGARRRQAGCRSRNRLA